MKIGSKYILTGILLTLLVAMSQIFVEKGEYINTTNDFISDNGFSVGTIKVEETHHLPERLSASLDGGGSIAYESYDTFLSVWMGAEVPFHALTVSWKEEASDGTTADIWVRTKHIDGSTSEWIKVEKDIDAQSNQEIEAVDEKGAHKYYSFLRTAMSLQIQYKVESSTKDTNITPVISEVEFTYIDAARSAANEDSNQDLVASLQIMPSGTDVKIISRSQWGANEDLRLFKGMGKPKQIDVSEEITSNFGDEIKLQKEIKQNSNGQLFTWPIQYPQSDIKAIFVHHTASQEDAMEDSYAAMRAIYYYHTVTRGWGDIGYNYLIDEDGRIFEGRYGGDKVIGAHTANFNVGTVGVAMIGNYQENEINGGAVEGLVRLLTSLTEKYKLDPIAILKLRGKNVNVISGHRDAGKTVCPGEHVYEKLVSIRQLIKNELEVRGTYKGVISTVRAANGIDFDDIDNRGFVIIGPEEIKTISFRLRNTGSKSWGRNTTLVYRNGDHNIAGFDEVVARLKEPSIGDGEIGTFEIPIQGSFSSGLKNYYLYLAVGQELSERQILFPVYIEPVDLRFSLIKIDKAPKIKLNKNEDTKTTFTIVNKSNITWTAFNVSLLSQAKDSLFVDGKMISPGAIQPGQRATFEASFRSGNTVGQFEEHLRLVLTDSKGGKVFSKTSQDFVFRIDGPTTLKSGEKILLAGSSEIHTLKPGESTYAWIEIENNTNEVWTRAGAEHIYIATLKAPSIKVGNMLMTKGTIKPGETTKIYFDLRAPEKEGKYFVNFIFRHKDVRLTKKQMRFDFIVSKDSTEVYTAPTRQNIEVDNTSIGQDTIRVALPFEGNPSITSDTNLRVYDSSGKDLNNGSIIKSGTNLTVSYMNGKYEVAIGNKKITTDKYVRIGSEGGILRIINFSNPPLWNPNLNDNEYRGVLEVRAIDSKLMVINELPLEQYLYGIAEVSNTDHVEKIKTLAVIARTYAKYYIDRRGTAEVKFPGKPYDLDSSPDVSQKYLGYGLEKRSPKIKAGIDATRGEVVTYEDKIVKTPYFNTTDGTATKSAAEVWGWKNTPYLVSVPDPLCESKTFSGHGVGLSGCGATAAAERGYSYKDIIKYYYIGVEIKDLY
ncbi:MAG: SpoIID/LytB domain-containing protein [Candidatus Peregrinibacteria bacterium]|nr:SpoIID/LytB domain-containing protein [Candidatus Peregrinibacteria bacterium]MDZ4244566.1 SpoIID/LytB domain-containing protein [Candidatus Gracilibacteria bacterium]